MASMARVSGSTRVVLAALAGNLGVAAVKFAAYGFTRSAAMLSEAVHSLVDTADQLLLLVGQRRAARPPDPSHPFGYGMEMYFWAFIVAAGVGISLGVIAAVKQNSWADYLAVGVTIGAQVLPNFVLAPILVLIFTLGLHWLPGGGWNGGKWNYVVLPVIALATTYMANIARFMRSSMLEVLHSNFIRTARAKGLPGHEVVLKHALKPALLPVISYLGPVFVGMITGSVVVDFYFSTGGIGQAFINSALNRDYSTILGVTILLGALTIAGNLVVDVLYAWIDPKIRY